MTQEEWHAGWVRCIGLVLNGRTLDDMNAIGEPIRDDTFLILLNPHHEPVRFTLPHARAGMGWELRLDTRNQGVPKPRSVSSRRSYRMIPRSFALFREVSIGEPSPNA